MALQNISDPSVPYSDSDMMVRKTSARDSVILNLASRRNVQQCTNIILFIITLGFRCFKVVDRPIARRAP